MIAAAIVVVVLGYYAWVWRSFSAFVSAIDHCDEPFCDFYRHYYPMAREIFRAKLPTPGFFYSPFVAILLSVFRPLDIGSALVVWGVFQALLIAGLATAPRAFGIRSIPLLLLHLFLVLTAFPVVHNFKWGQISVLLVLSLLACFYFYRRGRKVVSAVLLAFAIAIKFFPVFFLLYFVVRRDWRFCLACVVASAVFLVGVPALALGWGETWSYYAGLRYILGLAQGYLIDPNSQYFPNVARRIVEGISFDGTVPFRQLVDENMRLQGSLRVVGYAVAAANIALLYFSVRARERAGRDTVVWGFVVLSLTLPFVVRTSWPHYFVYLPFCQVFLWHEIARGEVPRRRLLLGLLVVPSMVLSSIFLFNALAAGDFVLLKAVERRSVYSFWGCPFFANLLLLVAVYAGLGGDAGRRATPPPDLGA